MRELEYHRLMSFCTPHRTPKKTQQEIDAQTPCGAIRQNGLACRNKGTGAGGRCKHHGGATPVGIASHAYKDGRTSRYLPARLSSRYEEALRDPNLLASRQDIALLESRLQEVLVLLDSTESGERWDALRDALARYDRAAAQSRANPNSRARVEAWDSIRRLISEGHADQENWREIRAILQEHRALKESERKRLVDAQQMITVTQANLLLGAVAHIVKTHVTDQRTLESIARELGRLVSVEPGHAVTPALAGRARS